MIEPKTYEKAAEALRKASADGARVRFRGGGTKLGWGAPVPEPDVEISTAKLDRIVEHNEGDLTAVVQAGVKLATLREELASKGQMLALDPPLRTDDGATIGGVLATADSGPLRHRYGGPRDLVLGVTVALSDGTIARAGGKVIKNVAGYDLAKLFTGSYGTLGAILEVAVRLHPLPREPVTVSGASGDPAAVVAAAAALAHSPLELQCLDARMYPSEGTVYARIAGAAASTQADAAMRMVEEAGCVGGLVEDDAAVWQQQRDLQTSSGGTMVRVSGSQSQLASQERAVSRRRGWRLVARPTLGLGWIDVNGPQIENLGETRDWPSEEQVVEWLDDVRRELGPSPCVVLDANPSVRRGLDVWGDVDGPALALMQRVKARFDPAGTCNPGVFVGGI